MPKLRSDYPVPISVRVSQDLAERIKAAAERDHRTVSGFVRLHLQRTMKEDPAQANGASASLEHS